MKKMIYMSLFVAGLTAFIGQTAYSQVSTGPKNDSRSSNEKSRDRRAPLPTPGNSKDKITSTDVRNSRAGIAPVNFNSENIGTVRRSDINYSRQQRSSVHHSLPSGYERLYPINGRNYYYHSGNYYADAHGRFAQTSPHVGFRVKMIPAGHTRISVKRNVFYYYNGVFYTMNRRYYEVVHPPVGMMVNAIPSHSERIYLYGNLYYEFNGIIYRKSGRKFQVAGFLDY